MTTHRFDIDVPNPSENAVVARLRLEPIALATLGEVPLDLPEGELQTNSAWIGLDPCKEDGEKEVELELEPHSNRKVHVVVDVAGEKGSTGVNLIDERPGAAQPGGVTLVVVQGLVDRPGTIVESRNPCPIILAEDPWWQPIDAEPDDPRPVGPIPVGAWVELVAPILNPAEGPLDNATVYLEHLGRSPARFESALWNIGTFEAGDVFLAVWRIRGERWAAGVGEVSIVVESRGTDAIRLAGRIDFGKGEEFPDVRQVDTAPVG